MSFIVLLCITENSVNAVSPFTQSSAENTGQLDIIVPKPLRFSIDNNLTSGHFHVYNSTGYLLKPVQEVNCTVHIYDQNNKHALEQNTTADSNGEDLKVNLSSLEFKTIGEYGFVIWCESYDNEAGFFSSSFTITRSGLEYSDHSGFIGYMILVVGIVALLFVFSNGVDTNKDWLQAIKLLVNMVALIILLAGSGFAVRTLYLFDYPETVVNIATTIFIALLFVVVPVFLIFLVMFVKQLMEFWTELKTGDDFG